MSRKNIILAHEKKYVILKDGDGSFGVGLDKNGENVVKEVEENDLIPEIRKEIMKMCKAVNSKELKKQILIW
ncbi:hypothetical protein ACQ9BO_08780 [Flavobacterium sp. P21]|uniref:hypothetical protein n=1 Tax=Flavobacterium sp. P21 TaxID=3423948 RepID=UPI003D67EFAF